MINFLVGTGLPRPSSAEPSKADSHLYKEEHPITGVAFLRRRCGTISTAAS